MSGQTPGISVPHFNPMSVCPSVPPSFYLLIPTQGHVRQSLNCTLKLNFTGGTECYFAHGNSGMMVANVLCVSVGSLSSVIRYLWWFHSDVIWVISNRAEVRSKTVTHCQYLWASGSAESVWILFNSLSLSLNCMEMQHNPFSKCPRKICEISKSACSRGG